jgi:hypothetical protein
VFRREQDVTPSRVFTADDDGRMVLLGDGYFGVRTPRWPVELVRGAVLASLGVIATIPLAVGVWLVRGDAGRNRSTAAAASGARPARALQVTLALLPVAMLVSLSITLAPVREWGEMNTLTRLTFLGSCAVPLLSLVALILVAQAWMRRCGRWFTAYATAATLAGLCLSAYMAAWGLVGLRSWAY